VEQVVAEATFPQGFNEEISKLGGNRVDSPLHNF